MSTMIAFDRDKAFEMGKDESRDSRVSLSPFSVPVSIQASFQSRQLEIKFSYAGGDVSGPQHSLDDLKPNVTVSDGLLAGAMMEIILPGEKINQADLSSLEKRIRAAGRLQDRISKKLNYFLIADLLSNTLSEKLLQVQKS